MIPMRSGNRWRLFGLAVVLMLWMVLLRPTLLGGPATYVIVSGESMEPTLHSGDLVFALDRSSYRRGDVIVYRIAKGDAGAGAMVIHRVIGGSARDGYITQGDNREGRDQWRPKPDDVLGTMSVSVPHAGVALAFLRTPFAIAILGGLAAFFFISAGPRSRARPAPRAPAPGGSGR